MQFDRTIAKFVMLLHLHQSGAFSFFHYDSSIKKVVEMQENAKSKTKRTWLLVILLKYLFKCTKYQYLSLCSI